LSEDEILSEVNLQMYQIRSSASIINAVELHSHKTTTNNAFPAPLVYIMNSLNPSQNLCSLSDFIMNVQWCHLKMPHALCQC